MRKILKQKTVSGEKTISSKKDKREKVWWKNNQQREESLRAREKHAKQTKLISNKNVQLLR